MMKYSICYLGIEELQLIIIVCVRLGPRVLTVGLSHVTHRRMCFQSILPDLVKSRVWSAFLGVCADLAEKIL